MTAHSDKHSATDPRTPAKQDSLRERLSLTGPNRVHSRASTSQTAISTETLFGSKREILLSHGETLYRLRITSKDKLILTK